jgi:hypothetical protein
VDTWPAGDTRTKLAESRPSSLFDLVKLCDIDPKGEAFRYPLSAKKQGRRVRTLDSDLLDLDPGGVVAEVVEVIQLFDGAATGIEVYLDAKQGHAGGVPRDPGRVRRGGRERSTRTRRAGGVVMPGSSLGTHAGPRAHDATDTVFAAGTALIVPVPSGQQFRFGAPKEHLWQQSISS